MRRMRRGGRMSEDTLGMLKRSAVYVLVMFLFAVMRCSFFENLAFMPASPDLVLAAVSVIAFTDSKETAVIAATAGGIITDAIGGAGAYLSPLLYFAVAMIIGIFAKKMMEKYLSWLALLPVACILAALVTFLENFVGVAGASAIDILLNTVLPELAVSALLALPIYPLIRLCVLPFKKRRGMIIHSGD